MSGRAVAFLALALVFSGRVIRADSITQAPYMPYAGVWFYLAPDPDFGYGPFNEGRIMVGCANGTCEWDRLIYAEGWYQDPVSHTNYRQTMSWFGYTVYCCSETQNWWNYFNGYLRAAWDCFDIRSDINQEYVDWGVYADGGYLPGCVIGGNGLTQGPGWGPFPFSLLNDGNYSWGVIRNNYLYDFTAQMQSQVQYQFGYNIRVTSGYRNPYRNWQVGGAYLSRHQWGDAVDVKPASAPGGCIGQATWNELHTGALNAGGTWFELYSDDCTHLHVDLRNW